MKKYVKVVNLLELAIQCPKMAATQVLQHAATVTSTTKLSHLGAGRRLPRTPAPICSQQSSFPHFQGRLLSQGSIQAAGVTLSTAALFKFGEMAMSHKKTRMEAAWGIQKKTKNKSGLNLGLQSLLLGL